MIHISDIKLIRTDTTLDLSQKAEKVLLVPASDVGLSYMSSTFRVLLISVCLFHQQPSNYNKSCSNLV
ncbi:hypothetical protein CR513_26325, partial [Mucuna pruriens]